MSKKDKIAVRLAAHQDPQDRSQISNLYNVTLWKIDGDECGDSSGGPVTFYALTEDALKLPDPNGAIDAISKGRYSLYNLNSIEKIISTENDCNWDDETGTMYTFDYYEECDNQTGHPMTTDVAKLVSGLMKRVAGLWKDIARLRRELAVAQIELSKMKGKVQGEVA